MCKAALIYLTQQLAAELGPDVRVNAIVPGVVDTKFAAPLVGLGAGLYGRWPLPRLGQPADIASAAEFLAGDASAWMTGQVLIIDGGAGLPGSPFDAAAAPAAPAAATGDGGRGVSRAVALSEPEPGITGSG
jgi:NAD(P)-dependent dehydrogenase (short-subunit alcohol dehydrogenase family)